MQITPYNSTPGFKGYDARRISALAMTTNKGRIAEEMKAIGDKNGFSIWLAGHDDLFERGFENVHERYPYTTCWAQDIAGVTPDGKVFYPWLNDGLGWLLATFKRFRGVLAQNHVAGGNYFVVKNGNKNDLIVGSNAVAAVGSDTLKSRFHVEHVHVIPQMDYHIDMGIRPLNNRNILVCDDDMTIAELEKAVKNTEDFSIVNESLGILLERFKGAVRRNMYEKPEKVSKLLAGYGYNPVKVPGRIYDVKFKPSAQTTGIVYDMNFVNAVALENNKNEIVYITNKSLLDRKFGITPEIEKKTGFSFEKMFKDSIKPYVDEKNIYFVSGDNDVIADYLTNFDGGIHCLCAEIP